MSSDPPARLAWIQVDSADPEQLARFWAALLDVEVEERTGSGPLGPRYVVLDSQEGANVALSFQWVSEPKLSKNRLHLDVVAVRGLDQVTRLVEELGGPGIQTATSLSTAGIGGSWRILREMSSV